jgi:phage terminase large subunit GpA-like protein
MKSLAPPPDLTVSEWAEAERFLSPETSNAPGPWRNATTPYLVEVMDCFSDPRVEKIVMMTSSRVGKTATLENAIGYFVAQDPCAIGVYFPNADEAARFGKKHLDPMLRDTPALAGKVVAARGNQSGSTTTEKIYPGGTLELLSANSPADLAGRTFRVVLMDEVDRFPANVGGEGDPVALAEKRAETAQVGRKIGLASTPTLAGASLIAREYEASDRRRYHVPCPHCGHMQHLRWAQVRWQKEEVEGRGERWDYGSARYHCESCDAPWTDADRIRALARGEWRAEAPFQGVAGFNLNTLYSPFTTMARLVRDWERAQADREKLKAFINTTLGEVWEDRVGQPSSVDALLARREVYPAEVPPGAAILTLGGDAQSSPAGLAWEVVGWGKDGESWSIAAGFIEQQPGTPAFEAELESIRLRHWKRADGTTVQIAACALDTGGHYTDAITAYALPRRGQRVYPIKGVGDTPGQRRQVWPTGLVASGKGAGKVWPVGVQAAKDVALGSLDITTPGPGYCHFPADRDASWFEQLLAERRVHVKGHGGLTQWQPRPGFRTEAADCRVYAYVALTALRSMFPGTFNRALAAEQQRLAAWAAAGGETAPVAAPQPDVRPEPVAPAVPEPKPTPAAPARVPWRPTPQPGVPRGGGRPQTVFDKRGAGRRW